MTHQTLHWVTVSESFLAWRRSLLCLQLIIIQLFALYIDACNEFSFLSSKGSIAFCNIFGPKTVRIPTVKLKIPGKSRIQKFCYIQVIVFDLSYLPVAAVGT